MRLAVLVEEEDSRRQLTERLQQHGHTVSSYDNLSSLGEALDENPIDVLLSDDLEVLVKLSFLIKAVPRMAALLSASVVYVGASPANAESGGVVKNILAAVKVTSLFHKYFEPLKTSFPLPY